MVNKVVKSDTLRIDVNGNLLQGLDSDAKIIRTKKATKGVKVEAKRLEALRLAKEAEELAKKSREEAKRLKAEANKLNATTKAPAKVSVIGGSVGETVGFDIPDNLEEDDKVRLAEKLGDPIWRIFSGELYKITDKNGTIMPFVPNSAQTYLFYNMHIKNIILKARQQGFTTFIALLALDYILFNAGKSAGLIAHNLDDASKISRLKIHFAYDKLPVWLREIVPVGKRTDSEITFSVNNGGLYVDTSFRGGTLQFLHISEYAKIGVIDPNKAKEIKTGALNAIGREGMVFIESTSEGPYGEFYDMCVRAMKKQLSGAKLTKMDYKFFFFPWFLSDEYSLFDDEMEDLEVSREIEEYFDLLKGDEYISKAFPDIVFTKGQKLWYQLKKDEQGDSMLQEYPSTPKEAFDAVIDGAYYDKEIAYLRENKHVGSGYYVEGRPVYTAWDIGISDEMAIWFYQVGRGGYVYIIDYFEGSGWSMIDICESVIHTKPYTYATHYLPHDAEVRNVITGKSRVDEIREYLGDVNVLPKLSIMDGINRARTLLKKCFFDEYNCSEGFDHLASYSRERDKKTGIFKSKPRHDEHSHSADAFRYLALAYEEEYKNQGVVFESTGLNLEYYGYDTTYKKPKEDIPEVSMAGIEGIDISLNF